MKKKDDVELDEFAQEQHKRFLAALNQPASPEDQLRFQVGNTAMGGLETTGDLEVIKAADVKKDSARTKNKES